jgi:outer membrane protein assembly factor BamB
LAASVVGAPAALRTGTERSLALALSNGIVEVRNMSGKGLRTIKLDAAITTAPLALQMTNASILMIGTDKGLIALSGIDLRPLWRVATDKADAPRGALAAADLDGDGVPEALMITRSNRVVAISISTGKIKWYAAGATDAASAAFADLNGDNSLDVIIAAVPSFAIGLNGRDGSLIWRADETGQARQQGTGDAGAVRVLVAAPVNANSSFLVGSDPAHVGLRAVGLPQAAAVNR